MMLIKEDKENQKLIMLVPKCQKCDRIMYDLQFKFYKDPTFTETESFGSFFWTEFRYQCRHCWGVVSLSKHELDLMNSYPLDKIDFPPGFDAKHLKVERISK